MTTYKRKYLIFALLCCIYAADAQSVKNIYIDPEKAHGGNCNEYLQNIDYIPLETTSESLFGDISQLIITDSSYVIKDNDTKAVLFFSLTGKYLSKKKWKENESMLLQHDKSNKRIQLSIYQKAIRKSNTQTYSYTGILTPTTYLSPSHGKFLVPLKNNYYMGTRGYWRSVKDNLPDSCYPLIDIYRDNTLYKSHLCYNPKTKPLYFFLGEYLNISPSTEAVDGAVYLCTPYDFKLYMVTKDTVSQLGQIILPASMVAPSTLINISGFEKEKLDSCFRELSSNSDYITGISNITLKQDTLFFKKDTRSYLIYNGSEVRQQYNFMYNLSTGKLVSFERLSPDTSTYHLPIIGNSSINKLQGLYFKDNTIYSSVSALELFNAYDQNIEKARKIVYPEKLSGFFSKKNRQANPMITKMSIKNAR